MILKSLSRKAGGTRQLFTYLFANPEKLADKDHKPLVIRHNIRSRKLENMMKEFEVNESLRIHRRKDNTHLHHVILSLSNKDRQHVNEKVLRDITREFVQLRGRENMFLATAHYDRDHTHIHCIVSGTEYMTGKSNRLSLMQFNELKIALDAFQKEKYPELSNSLPAHGRKALTRSDREHQLERRSGRESDKQTLLKVLDDAYINSKSLDQFLSKVKASHFEPYYRAGRLQGVKSEGERKFRLSRLGYDKEKLAELDREQLKEKEALDEIQSIRARHVPDREREADEHEREPEFDRDDEDTEEDEKELEETDNSDDPSEEEAEDSDSYPDDDEDESDSGE